ncbi:chemotaxis protein CheD [Caldibacillus debilis]|jgi:chemotaxis protein CheD|uniref:Probable chemoreceptor glutamine deamidase CheD n=1 Tax=Caldibacillus debilis GB1 TaxID=1339248 RepID=A0A420VBG0_9BACI|nr:chemotaxis protein CheD [Caldibacillus debilis]RKO60932.1 Chemotaxis protein [Caldibacillus debilis GB1]
MKSSPSIIQVGIAEMNIVRSPSVIRTSGLGSCVGVIIYDLPQQLAGMVHVMLPDSSLARTKAFNPAKFADTAIPALFQLLIQNGARSKNLKAKLAGGSQMFKTTLKSDLMRIGPRNVEAVEDELAKLNIPVVAKDVGGSSGRTIEFDPQTGILTVRTVNKGIREI